MKILFFILMCINMGKFNVDNLMYSYDNLIQNKFYNTDYKFDFNEEYQIPIENVVAGIVPHHILAEEMIDKFFKTISKKDMDCLVLLSPNHTNCGRYKIYTSNKDWDTGVGVLKSDNKTIEKLSFNKLISVDNNILQNEHGIGTLLPYIKYYMPNVKIVPIIISSNLEREEFARFKDLLWESLESKNTVVVGSVDFSHYLSCEQALLKDLEMKKIIENENLFKIERLNSDYLDSPYVLLEILDFKKRKNANKCFWLEHKNAQDYLKNKVNETTTYRTFVFSK